MISDLERRPIEPELATIMEAQEADQRGQRHETPLGTMQRLARRPLFVSAARRCANHLQYITVTRHGHPLPVA